MASETQSPGTLASDPAVGNIAWTDPANASASDDTYATAALTLAFDQSEYLKATNFGFSIPAGATIDGIECTAERKSVGGDVTDVSVRIVKGGTIGATNRSAGDSWPAVEASKTWGSNSDLWGETWTAADINAADFGFALSGDTMAGTETASVDHMQITVYYTPAGGPANMLLTGVG